MILESNNLMVATGVGHLPTNRKIAPAVQVEAKSIGCQSLIASVRRR